MQRTVPDAVAARPTLAPLGLEVADRTAIVRRCGRTFTECGPASAIAEINLNALFVFSQVADANSFSEGARRLKMAVSTVSRQVAELEAQLGARLLERSTRKLSLTAFGSRVLEYGRNSIQMGEALLSLISDETLGVSGLLKISAPAGIADVVIAPLVSRFQSAFPDVRVHVRLENEFNDKANNDFDVAFRVGPMKDSSLVARKILSFRPRLVASRDYLQIREIPSTPDKLAAHRILACSYGHDADRWHFVHVDTKEKVTVEIEPYLRLSSSPSLAIHILEGAGIGNLVSKTGAPRLEAVEVIDLLPKWRFEDFDLLMLHKGHRHVARPVREFTSFATRAAATVMRSSTSGHPVLRKQCA